MGSKMMSNVKAAYENLETVRRFRIIALEVHSQFACRAACEMPSLADVLIDEIVDRLDPQTMSDVRSMPAELQESAVSYLLGSLDNTTVIPHGHPTYFCTDWHDRELHGPSVLLALLEDG